MTDVGQIERYTQIFIPMDLVLNRETQTLQTKRDKYKYKKIKQSMMQELLTGKTRLV